MTSAYVTAQPLASERKRASRTTSRKLKHADGVVPEFLGGKGKIGRCDVARSRKLASWWWSKPEFRDGMSASIASVCACSIHKLRFSAAADRWKKAGDFSNDIAVRGACNSHCEGCRVVLEEEDSAPTNQVPVCPRYRQGADELYGVNDISAAIDGLRDGPHRVVTWFSNHGGHG